MYLSNNEVASNFINNLLEREKSSVMGALYIEGTGDIIDSCIDSLKEEAYGSCDFEYVRGYNDFYKITSSYDEGLTVNIYVVELEDEDVEDDYNEDDYNEDDYNNDLDYDSEGSFTPNKEYFKKI